MPAALRRHGQDIRQRDHQAVHGRDLTDERCESLATDDACGVGQGANVVEAGTTTTVERARSSTAVETDPARKCAAEFMSRCPRMITSRGEAISLRTVSTSP